MDTRYNIYIYISISTVLHIHINTHTSGVNHNYVKISTFNGKLLLVSVELSGIESKHLSYLHICG